MSPTYKGLTKSTDRQMMMMVKKNSPQAFVLLLLLLCIASTCSVVATTSTNKSWKVETPSWETKKVGPNHYHSHENDGSEEVPAPWPLLVPRRKEETVLLRFTYGDQSKRKLETETTHEDEGSELSVHVTYEELCKFKFQKVIITSLYD